MYVLWNGLFIFVLIYMYKGVILSTAIVTYLKCLVKIFFFLLKLTLTFVNIKSMNVYPYLYCSIIIPTFH